MGTFINAEHNQELKKRYQQSGKRLILLDYDGTLTPIVPLPEMAEPSREILDLLNTLSADNRNTVYIISGRDRDTLQQWLGAVPLNLIAEHGAWLKTDVGGWLVNGSLKTNWMEPVNALFQEFVDQCPGSFIETKSFSLAWHYRNAEQSQGAILATQILEQLAQKARSLNIDVIDGNKVIEVKNRGISKGEAIKPLLKKDFDFILACGDDTTDEDMFRELKDSEKAITVKIGTQPSEAAFRVENTETLLSLLVGLFN